MAGVMIPRRQAAFAFIFITVALDMLAIGIVIPVLPMLVREFLGGDTPRAAEIYGLFGTAWALMQFLFSPVLGGLSDRFGRRRVILASNIGLGLDYILMALAPTLAWLFIGRLINGITSASISTAHAYIADITPMEKRAGTYGMLGAAFGLGFVLGPALGGVLGAVDPRLPFWVAAGLSLANALYGAFVLPESLPPERRAAFAWRRANPLGALQLLRKHDGLLSLAGISFLNRLAHAVLPSTAVLYMNHRYGWNERDIGLTLAAVGVCAVIVQAGLVRPVVARLGEARTLMIGLVSGGLGFAVYGFAPTGASFLVGVPLMGLWGLASPSAQALMTSRVDPTEQGRLQGANASLGGIADMIGPTLFAVIFAWFIATGRAVPIPGAPFILAAVMMLAAIAVLLLRQRRAD
ncbi:MAG: TCR/Tet family MFS transporter [Alphaproteobacteria bacterium]|nr:TCR/Tet family MFS transporter [Alphaproteobacteria bacterium]